MNTAKHLVQELSSEIDQQEKPFVSASQLKQYWEDKNTDCPACDGTGVFGQWLRTCFRCKGKGYMNSDDKTRFEKRQAHLSRGTRAVTFAHHEGKNGDNSWG